MLFSWAGIHCFLFCFYFKTTFRSIHIYIYIWFDCTTHLSTTYWRPCYEESNTMKDTQTDNGHLSKEKWIPEQSPSGIMWQFIAIRGSCKNIHAVTYYTEHGNHTYHITFLRSTFICIGINIQNAHKARQPIKNLEDNTTVNVFRM